MSVFQLSLLFLSAASLCWSQFPLPWLSRCHLSLVRVLSAKEQYIRSGQLFLLCGTDRLFQLWDGRSSHSIHSSSFVFFPFWHIDLRVLILLGLISRRWLPAVRVPNSDHCTPNSDIDEVVGTSYTTSGGCDNTTCHVHVLNYPCVPIKQRQILMRTT